MNCAASAVRSAPSEGRVYPLAKFVRIINVNLIALSTCCGCSRSGGDRSACWRERGVIINTPASRPIGQIGQIAYSRQGRLVGLTLPAARDLASLKIRVNTIAPGLFLTPL